ncbi:MAG: hypothetical protein OXU70_08405 [Gammaproteobacteria bacterium]|nr:hypothetical protein [Gammaproteobacteria bacterium]
MKQTDLQSLFEGFVDDAHGVLGCALVDSATGLPIASNLRPESGLTEEAMTFLLAAGVSCFSDPSAAAGSSPNSGGEGRLRDGVREIQVTTEFAFLFMSLAPSAEQELLVLVTDRSNSLGLGWMMMRQLMEKVLALDVEIPAEQRTAARASAYLPQFAPAPEPEPQFQVRRAVGRRTIWNR